MWDYQILKEKFYRLTQDAENNVRKDKLKAPKAPPVYEGLHDISLARRDICMLLATSHYTSKQDFIEGLKKLLDSPAKNSNAFNDQKYAEARDSFLQSLITEYQ
jgi:hypothetical protein